MSIAIVEEDELRGLRPGPQQDGKTHHYDGGLTRRKKELRDFENLFDTALPHLLRVALLVPVLRPVVGAIIRASVHRKD